MLSDPALTFAGRRTLFNYAFRYQRVRTDPDDFPGGRNELVLDWGRIDTHLRPVTGPRALPAASGGTTHQMTRAEIMRMVTLLRRSVTGATAGGRSGIVRRIAYQLNEQDRADFLTLIGQRGRQRFYDWIGVANGEAWDGSFVLDEIENSPVFPCASPVFGARR